MNVVQSPELPIFIMPWDLKATDFSLDFQTKEVGDYLQDLHLKVRTACKMIGADDVLTKLQKSKRMLEMLIAPE